MDLKPREPWIGSAYRIFTKVFDAKTFNLEQEKRFKFLFAASSEDVVLEAIDLMWSEGVRYPTGREAREAIERVTLKNAMQSWAEPASGPWISFREWFDQQDDDMKARVRRVFPSLEWLT